MSRRQRKRLRKRESRQKKRDEELKLGISGGTGTFSIPSRVRALGYSSYSEYLLSDHWLNIRRKTFERVYKAYRNPLCEVCGKTDIALSVHHMTYKRLGKERMMDLLLVCRDCHQRVHDLAVSERMHPWRASKKLQKQTRHGAIWWSSPMVAGTFGPASPVRHIVANGKLVSEDLELPPWD